VHLVGFIIGMDASYFSGIWSMRFPNKYVLITRPH